MCWSHLSLFPPQIIMAPRPEVGSDSSPSLGTSPVYLKPPHSVCWCHLSLTFLPYLPLRQMTRTPIKIRRSLRPTPPWIWWMRRTRRSRRTTRGISPSSQTLGSSGQVRRRGHFTSTMYRERIPSPENLALIQHFVCLLCRAGHKRKDYESPDWYCEVCPAARTPLSVHLLAGRSQLGFPAGGR